MTRRAALWVAVVSITVTLAPAVAARAQAARKGTPERYRPSDAERAELQQRLDALGKALSALPRGRTRELDAWADVAVYHKAGTWALRLGEFYNAKDVAATVKVVERGLERARQVANGKAPWADARGSAIRGYLSKVDGSVQPYAVIVPEGLEPSAGQRARLDVVLHGRGDTLNEVHFIQAHDGKPALKTEGTEPAITLHVYGRGNNAYRWAGEADVFEAIEAVKRLYKVDDERIVLQGFSMGGAGAWHLGLHHPSLWASVEAGAGFSETRQYAKLKEVAEVEEKTLHIYDAVDYALNAFDVPIAGYGGDQDPQKQASVNIENALKGLGFEMKTEGLVTRGAGIDFLRVVGAGVGHKVDPASRKLLDAFHNEHAAKGVDQDKKHLRFVTYTLKYNRAEWLTVERLGEHYRRALVDAEIQGKKVVVREADNIVVLSVDRRAGETIRIGEQEFPLESAVKGLLPNVYFRHEVGEWRQLDYDQSRSIEENAKREKHHNLQGPIDDAFTRAFLCVRGTGTPWNPRVHGWAEARLQRFGEEWRQWMRGELPVKADTEVTDEDIETRSLILFGDPGSNRVLARILKDLPLGWTRSEVQLGGTFRAENHVPVLIAPNPLNAHHYVVLNSGHTFGAKEFAGTNALLYPRLGDYAVFSASLTETPQISGFFNEKWQVPKARVAK
ncbi:MAG: alpha/beta hydrolase-fold protein [Isosphaeraceae bacterium]|nr:alpha/beta hydrolase-fold protein [Isosphaeraceae bacterium]